LNRAAERRDAAEPWQTLENKSSSYNGGPLPNIAARLQLCHLATDHRLKLADYVVHRSRPLGLIWGLKNS